MFRSVCLSFSMTLMVMNACSSSLLNGSFEEPAVPAEQFLTIGPGDELSMEFKGWNVTAGNIDIVNIGYFGWRDAVAGDQFLDLNGTRNELVNDVAATITQAFPTLSGREYSLSFWYANNPGSPGGESALVNVTDEESGSSLLNSLIEHTSSTSTSPDWVQYRGIFQAVNNQTRLTFSSLAVGAGNSGGVMVDGVTVLLPGDFDEDGHLTAVDIDTLAEAIRIKTTEHKFDLDGNGLVEPSDYTHWVKTLANSWVGDANLDGEFNSTDFVHVFKGGQYEDSIVGNSGWATGDWDGDTEFDSSDFVAAFQDGGYERGPREAAHAVPEPISSVVLPMACLAALLWRQRA